MTTVIGFIIGIVLPLPAAVATFAWCNNRDIYEWRCLLAGLASGLGTLMFGLWLAGWPL